MNSKNRTLRKAVKLLIKGQLTRCIYFLEPKISLFLDSADYFYLLGRAYFAVGDPESAQLYLQRGLESDPNHEEIQLVQACFAVKEHDVYKAIAIWLKLDSAGSRRACLRYGLDQIRRINDNEELYNFIRSQRFSRLFPPLPGALSYRLGRRLRQVLLLLFFAVVFWFSYRFGTPKVQNLYQSWRNQRQASESLSLEGLDSSEYFSFERKTELFTFEQKDLESLIKDLRRNYDRYNDNLVQRDINKILLSNAGDKIKAKFRLVENLLESPKQFFELKNNFAFQEVRQNPPLYQNCYVRWQGKPTNIRIDENGELGFTLLVGYIDGSVLEGQVFVLLEDLISIPKDRPLAVFGRIKIKMDTDEAATFYIQAKTLEHV